MVVRISREYLTYSAVVVAIRGSPAPVQIPAKKPQSVSHVIIDIESYPEER